MVYTTQPLATHKISEFCLCLLWEGGKMNVEWKKENVIGSWNGNEWEDHLNSQTTHSSTRHTLSLSLRPHTLARNLIYSVIPRNAVDVFLKTLKLLLKYFDYCYYDVFISLSRRRLAFNLISAAFHPLIIRLMIAMCFTAHCSQEWVNASGHERITGSITRHDEMEKYLNLCDEEIQQILFGWLIILMRFFLLFFSSPSLARIKTRFHRNFFRLNVCILFTCMWRARALEWWGRKGDAKGRHVDKVIWDENLFTYKSVVGVIVTVVAQVLSSDWIINQRQW